MSKHQMKHWHNNFSYFQQPQNNSLCVPASNRIVPILVKPLSVIFYPKYYSLIGVFLHRFLWFLTEYHIFKESHLITTTINKIVFRVSAFDLKMIE